MTAQERVTTLPPDHPSNSQKARLIELAGAHIRPAQAARFAEAVQTDMRPPQGSPSSVDPAAAILTAPGRDEPGARRGAAPPRAGERGDAIAIPAVKAAHQPPSEAHSAQAVVARGEHQVAQRKTFDPAPIEAAIPVDLSVPWAGGGSAGTGAGGGATVWVDPPTPLDTAAAPAPLVSADMQQAAIATLTGTPAIPRPDAGVDPATAATPAPLRADPPATTTLATPLSATPDATRDSPSSVTVHHDPTGRIEVHLAPAELGRVRVEMTGDGDKMQIHLAVERPESLDLLRRHGEQLLQEFRQAGVTGGTLSFGTWGQSDQQQRPSSAAPPPPRMTPPPPDPVPGLAAQLRGLAAGSGLNLRL